MPSEFQPELVLALILGLSGLGTAYFLELVITGLLLIVVGALMYPMLKPPEHQMIGYGKLRPGQPVIASAPECATLNRLLNQNFTASRCLYARHKGRSSLMGLHSRMSMGERCCCVVSTSAGLASSLHRQQA